MTEDAAALAFAARYHGRFVYELRQEWSVRSIRTNVVGHLTKETRSTAKHAIFYWFARALPANADPRLYCRQDCVLRSAVSRLRARCPNGCDAGSV